MRAIVFGGALALLLLVGGCASKGISVSASSQERDIFQDPEGEKLDSLNRARGERSARRLGPFINLSTYDWNYSSWLASLGEMAADLRLPDSKDTVIEIRFFARDSASPPLVDIKCTADEQECGRLAVQIERLGAWPALPDDFPYDELIVKLSRLP